MAQRFASFRSWKHHRRKMRWCRLLANQALDEMSQRVGEPPLLVKRTGKLRSTDEASESLVNSMNVLITKHSQKGELDKARRLFDGMVTRDVVSWNAIIAGYAKWGLETEALKLVVEMHRADVGLNSISFRSALSICAGLKNLQFGRTVHCLAMRSGYANCEYSGFSLLDFYVKCDMVDEAQKVFDEQSQGTVVPWVLLLSAYVRRGRMDDANLLFERTPRKDVILWTTLISGYSRRGEAAKAFELFNRMLISGVSPNEFTFHAIVRVASCLKDLRLGKKIHGCLIAGGYESDFSISTALIDLYCHCDRVDDALHVFSQMEQPCLSSCNTLLDGLISNDRLGCAEELFFKMVERNSITCNVMIKGYARYGKITEARRLFDLMPQKTLVSFNTIISGYALNGELNDARRLFEAVDVKKRDTVTWNALMCGYVQNKLPGEALLLYVQMHKHAVKSNRSTLSSILSACACLGSLELGRSVHAQAAKSPCGSNVYVGTSCIDMYSKCGDIVSAKSTFFLMTERNVAAWTALINGYAFHGLGNEATALFDQMLEEGIEPNQVTFVGVLSACSHCGFVNKGMDYFISMKETYCITPTLEHYACIVYLLGRLGYLNEAEQFICNMPIRADAVVWGALLSGCRFYSNVEMGEKISDKICTLDCRNTSSCVAMSNIYAAAGRWIDVHSIRKRSSVVKDPGCSWVELGNTLHSFYVEGRYHPGSAKIYEVLDRLAVNINCTAQI
ncbi:Pentatricopeptide repeat-containing protein [Nymphaea thermarum]|nr:Pentatricopeptide repeat-containing protein [Nymphaea thermarum]